MIYRFYSSILNFTSNDSLIIDIHMENPRDVNGVIFSEKVQDLKWINLIQIKRYKVSKTHFISINNVNNSSFL